MAAAVVALVVAVYGVKFWHKFRTIRKGRIVLDLTFSFIVPSNWSLLTKSR